MQYDYGARKNPVVYRKHLTLLKVSVSKHDGALGQASLLFDLYVPVK